MAKKIVQLNAETKKTGSGNNRFVKGIMSGNILMDLLNTEYLENASLIRQMDNDPQVQLAKRTFQANIRAAGVSIHIPAELSGDERTKSLQKKLEAVWMMAEKKFGEAIAFGRVAFEVVFRYDPKNVLHYAAAIQDLPYEKTRMILEDVDKERKGAFNGIKLWNKGETVDAIEIPRCKSWWMSLDASVTQPHGVSRYAGAPYQTWKRRKTLSEFLDKFIKRYTLRGGVAHVPETVRDEETGTVYDVFEKTAEALQALFSGGVLLLSNERDAEGNYLYDFEQSTLQQFDSQPLLDIEKKFDADQLQSFGFPPKTLIEGDAVGSFALVTQQVLILYAVIEEVLDQFVSSFNRYIVKPHLDLNYEPGEAPEIEAVYPKMTQRPDALASEVVKAWLANGQLSPLVLSGAVDVEAILAGTGIPLSSDFAERLKDAVRFVIPTAPAGPPSFPPGRETDPVSGGQTTNSGDPATPPGVGSADPWLTPDAPVQFDGTPVNPPAIASETGADVAQTALNGAQISSLLEVVTAVTGGQLPAGSARPILEAAFPALDGSLFDRILTPLAGFQPRTTEPTPPASPPEKQPAATLANPGPLSPFLRRGAV